MLGTPVGGTVETVGSFCGSQSGVMWSAEQDYVNVLEGSSGLSLLYRRGKKFWRLSSLVL